MEEVRATITEGVIKGRVSKDYKGGKFLSFQGIPYAKPPIGDLRFKAPQPPERWDAEKDCTKDGSECFSLDFYQENKPVGSEDCLVLNVFTPKMPDGLTSPLPVMFYIHGGGFVAGSSKSDYIGPEYLMTGDVVLVTINYRLGVFGFLSFDDPSIGVPGNNGLKDMVMALKWVQRNIKTFNGDPNNVTIFGESAGSAATHLLVLSPMAKGLFHKAIMQSGSALNPWAQGRSCAKDMAKAMNFESTDEKEIYKKLMSATGEELLQAQNLTFAGVETYEKRCFGYVVEKPSIEEPFLTKEPLDIMLSGEYNKVPMMMGYTDKEGMFLEIWLNLCHIPFDVTMDFEKQIDHYFEVERGTDVSKKIAGMMREYYFGEKEPSKELIHNYYDFQTDKFFTRGIYQTARHIISTSPELAVYFYKFTVDKKLNFFKIIGGVKEKGAAHSDDLGYLFKTTLIPDVEPSSVEDQLVQRMVRLWSNFARTGNPNPIIVDTLIDVHWKPVKQDKLYFLEIGETLKDGTDPDKDRMMFWDEITALSPSAKNM